MDLRCIPHDLRVEDVRLELMDADDPHEHEDGRAEGLREAEEDRRNRADDRPEDWDEAQDGGDERKHRPVLQADDGETNRAENAVYQTDHELTANDARESVVDASQQEVPRRPSLRS